VHEALERHTTHASSLPDGIEMHWHFTGSQALRAARRLREVIIRLRRRTRVDVWPTGGVRDCRLDRRRISWPPARRRRSVDDSVASHRIRGLSVQCDSPKRPPPAPIILRRTLRRTAIGAARILSAEAARRLCLVAGGRSSRPGHQATAGRSAVPVMFLTFFTSLRMPNAEITSVTPRMISQIPTTSANVTIESNG
jgi:hypothetical protein